MRFAVPLLLALAACSESSTPDVAGLQKELAELRKELDELVKVRAEMCGALDELGTQLRKLREKTEPTAASLPPVLLNMPPPGTSAASSEFYWVLSPTRVKGEARTALALYRATKQGLALQSLRIVEEDVAQALEK